jgi:hypothetical protein
LPEELGVSKPRRDRELNKIRQIGFGGRFVRILDRRLTITELAKKDSPVDCPFFILAAQKVVTTFWLKFAS